MPPKAIGTRDTSPEIMQHIMKMHADNMKPSQIARGLDMKSATVYGIIRRGGVKKKSSGRPSKITADTGRAILDEVVKNPTAYAHEIAKVVKLSPKTIKRYLYNCGFDFVVQRNDKI